MKPKEKYEQETDEKAIGFFTGTHTENYVKFLERGEHLPSLEDVIKECPFVYSELQIEAIYNTIKKLMEGGEG